MSLNQNQISNLNITTIVAAALVGRPNELAHIAELDALFRFEVSAGYLNNGISIIPAVGTDAHWVRISDAVKSNMVATVAPAITDDAASLYEVGSTWVDTATDTSYVCLDNSVGAAVWSISAGGPVAVAQALHFGSVSDSTGITNVVFPYTAEFDTAPGTAVGIIVATATNSMTVARSGNYTVSLGASFRALSNIKTATLHVNGIASTVIAVTSAIANNPNACSATAHLSLSAGDVITLIISSAFSEVDVDVYGAYMSLTEIPSQNVTSASIANNLVSVVPPAITDDSSLGYTAGSVWIDTSAGISYTCTNATPGAAVWSVTGSTSAGSSVYVIADSGVNVVMIDNYEFRFTPAGNRYFEWRYNDGVGGSINLSDSVTLSHISSGTQSQARAGSLGSTFVPVWLDISLSLTISGDYQTLYWSDGISRYKFTGILNNAFVSNVFEMTKY